VMLLDNGILFSSSDQVTLLRPNGQELAFPLAGAKTFMAAGDSYVEIIASGGMWILRTDPGKEQLSLLPGIPLGEVTGATQGAVPRGVPPAAVPSGATKGAVPSGATKGAVPSGVPPGAVTTRGPELP
jgi:hypothetical protein